MGDNRKKQGVVHIRFVDSNTRALFKSLCLERKVTMQRCIESLMRWYEHHESDLPIPPLPRLQWKARLYFRCLDEDVYNGFVVQCTRRSHPIYLVVEALMRQFINTPNMFKFRPYHRNHKAEMREKQRLRKRKEKDNDDSN